MGGFATNGVNMTKLESYMVDGNFFATQFYADVDGHPDDKGLAFALEELKFFSRDAKWAKNDGRPIVTTFLFRVRNVPAALYKALGGFATNGVNMTKLESYMLEGNFFATQFYADVEGHPEDRSLVFAFEELAFYSKEMKILGVYPAHPFRATFAEETK